MEKSVLAFHEHSITGKCADFMKKNKKMMLAMLPMMFRGHKNGSCCEHNKANDENNRQLEQ
ncbi:MAG TPA: hypothetical protein P5510_00685 [Clostridia bacterium]|nr:hypothetical protein [Bacillota bacterium]HQE66074.1 hypothetical protein [Bacillota bacterium]HQJ36751.1 hypothetical protein [Bacillota bacterium]HRS20245.1 hypothetical protein [Clostridia bacterium]